MKKLLFFLPLLLLTGCSLPTPSDSSPIGETTGTVITDKVSFDASKIERNNNEYPVYKNILAYKDGYIGVLIGGQDGYQIDLVYSENGNIIKKSMPIFWYDVGYTYKNIYEYCLPYGVDATSDQWTRPETVSLDKCPLITSLPTCVEGADHSLPNDCFGGQIAFSYMYDLLQGNTNNPYFSEKLQAFETSL